MVTFLPILCFYWYPSFSFTLSFCPKLSPNFGKLKFPPKQILSYRPCKFACCFCFKPNNSPISQLRSFLKMSGIFAYVGKMDFQPVFSSCLQTSLASLMTALSQSHPYFVRCVKPNEKKVCNNHRQFFYQVPRTVSSPGANAFLRRSAGNKERGA